MKKLILSAVLVASTAISAMAQDASKLVTVVTSPDPQTQLMSMVLTMAAAQQGAEAHILLCGPAGDLALKDAPQSATAGQPPRDMSPQGLMQMIRQNTGATVEVCAIYLPGRGEDASVLLDGIGVAEPGAMATRLMAPDARVLSF
jgi:predicted peroxiredoxin